jgi:glyoxylase-like metal-dependent hydrolase (beta-lactamase superfamily II)
MQIGDIDIQPVVDGRILSKQRPTKPFPPPGSPLLDDQAGMVHADGVVDSTLGGFLVRAADRLAIVDAGGGPAFADGHHVPTIDLADPADPVTASLRSNGVTGDLAREIVADLEASTRIEQGQLPASLAALDVRPDEVTDVIFTHLHFDHIGWASADGRAFFPNATYRCAAADLQYFLDGPDEEQFVAGLFGALTARERLGPALDRIETWESDDTLMPGIDVRLAPGHTPGSSVVVVSDGTARALLLGDIVHCPLELMDDDFNLLVDHDQEMANRVREAYARELEGSDTVASAAHFPGLRFGRLLPGEATRRWTFDAA